MTVTANSLPIVSAGTDKTICSGDSVVLQFTGAEQCVWKENSETSQVSQTCEVVVRPTATTTYTVIGTDINGCSAIDSVVVKVNPLLIVYAGADKTICSGDSVALQSTGAEHCVWEKNFETSQVSQTCEVVVRPTATTTYTVIGTDINGCTSTSSVKIKIDSCLKNPSNNIEGFNVYPNPNDGEFTIEITGTKDEIVLLRIYNMIGEIVFKNQNLNIGSGIKKEIKLILNNGVYFIEVEFNDKSIIKKIVCFEKR